MSAQVFVVGAEITYRYHERGTPNKQAASHEVRGVVRRVSGTKERPRYLVEDKHGEWWVDGADVSGVVS
jgi:hypothetical protein